MNRQGLNRYVKHTQLSTVVLVKCRGQFKDVTLPEEMNTFILNDEVIMEGPIDPIIDWLSEHNEQIDYYRIEYDPKRYEKTLTNCRLEVNNEQKIETTTHQNPVIKQNVEVGTKTVIMNDCVIGPNVRIGHSCKLNESCIVSGTNRSKSKPTIIGDRVVIESDVIILSGVKIGNDVTIKSGSIVTCDINDGLVVEGVPANTVKLSAVKQIAKDLS